MLLVFTGVAFAEEKPIREGPDAFGYASFKDGKVRIKRSQLVFVEEEKTIKEGDKETRVRVIRQQWLIGTSDLDPKKVKLYDEKGKQVAEKEVAKVLEKEQRVIISVSAKLDPFFADFIKPGTYIIVLDD